jgi:O-antigen ligase/Tfp pilus assembly protein PilF
MIKTLRWTALSALFIIPFLALYTDNTIYFPFIVGKAFAFRMLVEIALAAWIALAIADKKYRPQFSWVLVFYALFAAWMFIADSLAVNPHKALWSNFERMDGWVTLIHLFLFFLVAGSILTADKLWRNWWLTFAGASALVCGYGLLQLFHWVPIDQGSTRVDGTLGNAEYIAGYLLFAIAITLWQAFDLKEKRQRSWRYTLFALAALQTIILVASGTRGTIIGFVVAAGFGALLWLFEAGKRGRQGAAIALVALVIAVGGFLIIQHQPIIQNNPILSRFADIGVSDLNVRFTIWHMALQGVKERPVVGWGQEGFNYVFNKYYDPSLYGQEPWFDRVHNLYLDWLIAGGIPALLLFLGLFATAIYSLYRGSVSRAERILLLCALVAYAVQGLVVFDNLFTYIPFAALLAAAHAARSKPIAALDRLSVPDSQSVSSVVVPVVTVALVLGLWFVNEPGIASGKDLIKALTPSNPTAQFAYFKQAVADNGFATQEVREQLLQFAASAVGTPNLPDTTKQDIVTYAVQQMNLELKRAPQDSRLHLQLATLFRSIGDFPDAEKESAIAAQYAPTKQALIIEQGLEAWQSGDTAAARTFFEKAYALDMHNDQGAAYAAVGHIVTKDIPGAKTILQTHFGTTVVDQPVLIAAYYVPKDWADLLPILALHAKNKGDAATSFQLAAAYNEAGQKAQAIQTVRDAIAAHPEAAAQGQAFLQQLGAK